jgi:hypothetical protein
MDRQTRPKGRTFSFNISFGRKARAFDRATGEPLPLDDPHVRELLERARAEAETSPDGTGMATNTESFSIDLADGQLRVGDGPSYEDGSGHSAPVDDPDKAREREAWDRLRLIAEGKGAYPDTQRLHAQLSLVVWVIVIALPLATLLLTLAAGESRETVVFFTFGAAAIGAMLRGTIR